MRIGSALDSAMTAATARVSSAEIVVGIPSYRNAGTIGQVARAVAEGLARSFSHVRAVVVNADGGSDDGTRPAVREALGDLPHVIGEYVGPPGKGSALRAVFEVTQRLGATAGAVVDSDLRSITPAWVERLLAPVLAGQADHVTPLYARHKHDGTITNTLAYPLTRALYGWRIRQPIGGEFGFSGELARDFLEGGALGEDAWVSDVARFGIDIFMTTTALARGARIVQAPLGAKVHDPKDPGADLAPMFRQVVGTAFRLAGANAARWRAVQGSRDVRVMGEFADVEPEAIAVDPAALLRRARRGPLDADDWVRAVYDAMLASARDPGRTDSYVDALVPLYCARVASFVDDARDLSTAEAERLVEQQALAFERAKPSLVERWP